MPETKNAVIPILMPQAGQSMEEGTIVKWRVKPGDKISMGQIIFDVETDKATVEVEATDAGRLARIVVPEGATLAVKQPVAYLAENDADVDKFLEVGIKITSVLVPKIAKDDPQEETDIAVPPDIIAKYKKYFAPDNKEKKKISPAARKIARERGIDLASISGGSGPGGRIISTDVLSHKAGAPGSAGILPAGGLEARAPGTTRRRMSKLRRAIAHNLLLSKQTVPHFYVRLTIDAGPLMAFYQAQKAAAACSLNDIIVLACARVINEFPQFRSQLDKDEIVESATVNIGIAVGIEDGLVVPVVLDAGRMTLAELAANTKRLANSARAGKLEGAGRGNFTITNLGMFGVEEFAAIINPPEPAILAVSAVRESVLVKDGAMRAGRVMTMTLSCDHRIIDGVLAAKFLARLKEFLEAPQT